MLLINQEGFNDTGGLEPRSLLEFSLNHAANKKHAVHHPGQHAGRGLGRMLVNPCMLLGTRYPVPPVGSDAPCNGDRRMQRARPRRIAACRTPFVLFSTAVWRPYIDGREHIFKCMLGLCSLFSHGHDAGSVRYMYLPKTKQQRQL